MWDIYIMRTANVTDDDVARRGVHNTSQSYVVENSMYAFLAIRKETERKLRWDAMVEGAPFELYIPKWRVPDVVSDRIKITVLLEKEVSETRRVITRVQIRAQPHLRNNNIYARVKYIRDYTKTVRYDPIGLANNWEIGCPYIPKSILPDDFPKALQIVVQWL